MRIDRGVTLTLPEDVLPPIEPWPARFSPPGDVTAPVVDCGLGLAEDFPVGAGGYIALLRRGTISFAAKAAFAHAAGAAAVVVSNSVPGPIQAYAGVAPLPIASITLEEGRRCARRWLRRRGSSPGSS